MTNSEDSQKNEPLRDAVFGDSGNWGGFNEAPGEKRDAVDAGDYKQNRMLDDLGALGEKTAKSKQSRAKNLRKGKGLFHRRSGGLVRGRNGVHARRGTVAKNPRSGGGSDPEYGGW